MKLPRIYARMGAGAAFAGALALLAAAPPVPRPAPRGAVTDHVIIISIDGLRPDAIEKYRAGTLRRLLREGSASLEAQTVYPSRTLPSHTSMLTGVAPEVHGVTWNSDQTSTQGVVPVPTVFELAKQAGFGTAAFFSKSKFRHLERPGSLDHAQSPDGSEHWLAIRTVADASDYLKHRRPGLLFVHIAEPDYAGHALGWMSFLYGWAVRRADGAVAQVLAAADQAFGSGQYTVIVTSDHGGHDREHGSREPRDMTIPWIIWGQGVLQGQQLPAGIRTMDTAATVLWLLGIPVPDWWVGAPVPGAFTRAAQVAAAGAQPVKQGLAGSASP